MSETLSTLGAGRLFDPQRADLTGIARTDPPLLLDEVLHKAFVEVNETGTEAAAATAAPALAGGPPPKPVIVDRPFLFVIRDSASGALLFVGRLADPRAP